jgi:hypothetical protein
MLAVATFCEDCDITHLAAGMAPALLRLLRTCGMEFVTVGPSVEHHGTRQPCFAAVTDLLAGVKATNPAYFEVIRHGLPRLCVSDSFDSAPIPSPSCSRACGPAILDGFTPRVCILPGPFSMDAIYGSSGQASSEWTVPRIEKSLCNQSIQAFHQPACQRQMKCGSRL